jgi:Skp family chaperone for outer membrane proteins
MHALLSLAAAFSLSAQDMGATRIAMFLPDQIIAKSVRGRKVFSELEVMKKNLEDKLQAKGAEGQKLTAQLQSPSISEEGREKITKELRDLEYAFKKLQEDSQGEYAKLQQRIFGQFQQEIGPIVEALAKEQKLQLVLQYQQGLIAYGEEAWLTSFSFEVAKRYDAKYETGAAAAAPAAKPAAPAAKPAAKPVKK